MGCGRIAQRHAQHIANFGELVAVCDIVSEKAQLLGKEYQCTPFSSIESLLDAGLEIDVISICTPNGLHARHTLQALRAGYHVLCEKLWLSMYRIVGK